MPNQDGTGPMGLGARTGRARGNCVAPLVQNQPQAGGLSADAKFEPRPRGRRGNGCGCGGRGRGHRNAGQS